jgi:hypothetical protein
MLSNFSVFIGTTVIVFIIILFLVIFAPKSKNFFNINDYYPDLEKLSKNQEVIDQTFIKLGLDCLNEADNMIDDYKKYPIFYEDKKPIKWKDWLDNKIEGKVEILPLYMFSKLHDENISIFNELINELKNINNINSIFFIKMSPKSKIIEHTGWAQLSNDNLRFIYCFNSFCFYETDCGIWINGEIKKLYKDYSYVYDSSKEHCIYNNTYDDIFFLVIDVERPNNIPKGISEYELENIV